MRVENDTSMYKRIQKVVRGAWDTSLVCVEDRVRVLYRKVV
jgi:hypothetical protein